MNFTTDLNRIECTLKYYEGHFHRKDICYSNNVVYQRINLHSKERNQHNIIKSDIFTKSQHLIINAAIDRVNSALVKRGFNQLPLHEYKNTKIKLKICT